MNINQTSSREPSCQAKILCKRTLLKSNRNVFIDKLLVVHFKSKY